MSKLPTVLITGASSGIGATYAERFARRGHNLVIVARDRERLEALATRLQGEYGIAVDVVQADLTNVNELATVEKRLKEDTQIGVLINNAGIGQSGTFTEQTVDSIDSLLSINITAVTKLAAAIAPRLVQAGEGAIVNIGSVVGFAPEFKMSVYGASKAYVLFLSQGLHLELNPRGVYVQAVLPAATRTEIWQRSGVDIDALPEVMEVGDLVDAAMVGYDRRELVTIPPLQAAECWNALDEARRLVMANIHQERPAERYKVAPKANT
ncbi:SDR family NAD(P)-dependent oxidoreductase [Pseudomonas sp. NFX15]|jgi:short-subunit dehydrogenase|uniref:SDR family NAD(P)-dependent oxidoreductase n=1 Tax=Pseudomonas sp. NFX15 TaxID=2816958 RepID=UPI003B8ABA21